MYSLCEVICKCVCSLFFCLFFFKQKTAYEMRISDWISDVCSSDLRKLCRISSEQYPRYVSRAAPDGGGADLRLENAGGEARPHGGPIRQAALGRSGRCGRRLAAQLLLRHPQRHRFPNARASPRHAADGHSVQPLGCDAVPQSGSCVVGYESRAEWYTSVSQ